MFTPEGQQISGGELIPHSNLRQLFTLRLLCGNVELIFQHGDRGFLRTGDAMRSSKGLGNFKNLFFYAPHGKPDGIKIVPLSEVATKDDFFNIKKSAPPTCSTHTASRSS